MRGYPGERRIDDRGLIVRQRGEVPPAVAVMPELAVLAVAGAAEPPNVAALAPPLVTGAAVVGRAVALVAPPVVVSPVCANAAPVPVGKPFVSIV